MLWNTNIFSIRVGENIIIVMGKLEINAALKVKKLNTNDICFVGQL